MARSWSPFGLALMALLAAGPAPAQQRPTQPGWPPPMAPQHAIAYAALDQNEWRGGDGPGVYRWAGEAWYGGALERLRLKSEGRLDTASGRLDDTEVAVLASRAVSAYFDLQGGARYDVRASPSRGWAVLGVEGLAPLRWDVGIYAYASTGGHDGARVEGRYDLFLTQRLVLQPQFELNLYRRSQPRRGLGAGLADLDSGLRLRYQIRREIAPYLGVTYQKRYGQTASFARARGQPVELVSVVAGLRLRY